MFMYFLMAMVTSFVTVFGLTLIGSLIHRKSLGTRCVVAVITSIVYGLILWFVFWKGEVGLYGPAPMFWSIFIGAIIAAVIASVSTDEDFLPSGIIPSAVVVVAYILYVLIGVLWIGQSDMFHAKTKAALIGDVKIVQDLNEIMEPADNDHICQVSIEIARTNAQNALSKLKLKDGAIPGSRYNIDEPTKQFVDGHYWWIFPLEFQGWLKWKEDPQIPGYLRVSAEDPSEQPQAVQTDKTGKEIHIKYATSACFDFKAERYLRTHGFMNSILEDWTYEVDDNWKPYYTVSVIERTLGFAGKKVLGVILFDLQTGEIKYFDKDKVPAWVDRSIPLEVLDANAKNWGEYANAGWWYNVWHNDKSQKPTPGWFLTYGNDQCHWFSGFTSMNDKDKALTGFMLMNARTGQANFFKATGVTEDVAYDAAKTLWNNFAGYEPTELVPYNIYGHLTYVIPMKCKDQFAGISLVALDNINIKARGNTLAEALGNYRNSITGASSNGLAPQAGQTKEVQLKGIVERMGQPISAQNPIVSFKLVGVGKIFQVAYSDANPKALLLNKGDEVVLTYTETTEIVVSVTSFDIPAVTLEKGSVTQSKYIDSKAKTDEEVERVDDQNKVETIINSDKFKDVDPEALQKFLDEQSKKTDK